MLPKDKERIMIEVTRRVYEQVIEQARQSQEAYLDNLVHEVFYYEDQRLDQDEQAVNAQQDRQWLDSIKRVYEKSSEQEKKKLLESIIRRHVEEVVGHFDVPTYELSTRLLPAAMGLLLTGLSPIKLVSRFPRLPNVSENILFGGHLDEVCQLQKKGTLIYVPTHSSNLDSIIAGFAIYMAGLPPVCYGAGLNLFHNRFLGYFMHRLGAYKVDRRKKHSLYKDVLKMYATVSMELGYDNLFFPGGTRCRSGAIERKLKLGLMGSGLAAYIHNIRSQAAKPNVYIVPCTINYQLVLEASTLIADHLKEAGRSRYIIEDDEFSKLGRVYAFMRNLVRMDAKIFFNFGQPCDPFGNDVDEQGRSLDPQGRVVDIRRYIMKNGRPDFDPPRDMQYTRELGQRVVDTFAKESVISSTHILAWTVFQHLLRDQRDPDFYRFLRQAAVDASLPMVEVYRMVKRVSGKLRNMEKAGRLKLSGGAGTGDETEIVDRALNLFDSYHIKPVLERRGDRLFVGDMNLLYYYRNRLWGYDLEEIAS